MKILKMKEINIPIMIGSRIDLTKFNFSFKDISILNIKSKKFEKYFDKFQPELKEEIWDFICDTQKQIYFKQEQKFAIVKNNPFINYDYQEILNVFRYLLIIYPSDLQIEHNIHLKEIDGNYSSYITSWDKKMSGEYPGKLLLASDDKISTVNKFAKFYFDRLNMNNFIGIVTENYITSFDTSHYQFQYLTLCIALESTINGNQELSYRLKRTIAILCGDDTSKCNIIYENLTKIYNLRSKIIHGEPYRIENVIEYLPQLIAIVSITIIELIIHDIQSNLELNEIITKLGFGDRSKISKTWKRYQLNFSMIVDSSWKKIQ